jgi:hypothetical protein
MSVVPTGLSQNNHTTWSFIIGGIPLTNFEVPTSFSIGHELKLAVHEYIAANGQPTIKTESLGSFYIPTTWTGTLFYTDAIQRALKLDALMLGGSPIHWVYGPLDYTVVIKKFTMTPKHQFEVDYSIDLQVISDNNGQTSGVDNSLSFDSGTQDLFNRAAEAMSTLLSYSNYQTMTLSDLIAGGGAPTDVPSVPIPQSIFTNGDYVASLLQNAYPLNAQPYSTLAAIVGAITTVISVIQPLAYELRNTAILEADLAVLSACLVALQGYGLLITNLNQLLGVSPSSTVVGNFVGSLFGLAAIYYPNAPLDLAVGLLAQSNGLNDFYVYNPTNITIPPLFQ